jgi:phosphatidylserine decarboxylase
MGEISMPIHWRFKFAVTFPFLKLFQKFFSVKPHNFQTLFNLFCENEF